MNVCLREGAERGKGRLSALTIHEIMKLILKTNEKKGFWTYRQGLIKTEAAAVNARIKVRHLLKVFYSSPAPQRVDHGRLPAMDWRLNQQHQQQTTLPSGSDWRLAPEKSAPDLNSNVGKEEALRSSFAYQQSQMTPTFQTSHEVTSLLVTKYSYMHIC